MLKILNRLQKQLIDALNRVDSPNFVGTSDDDVRQHPWVAQGEYNNRSILAIRHGEAVQFVVNVDGTVAMMTRYHALTRDDLFQVNAYMRACEEAVAMDDGETMVQRRDIDAALQASNPEFRKTDAFRRLDDAMGV
jgi:hypothetical protein